MAYDQLEDQFMNLKRQSHVIAAGASDDICKMWLDIGKRHEFCLIGELASLLCLTPHSNAVAERVFSMIGKNLRADRKSLDKDTTLTNIMAIKCAGLPDNFTPSLELQKKAKHTTKDN